MARTAHGPLDNDSKLRNRIALQILRYLLDHPEAADSGAGIGLYWIHNDGPVPQAVVRDVLECLVRRQWLRTYGSDAETRIYRLSTSEVDAVKRFLQEPGEDRHG